MKYIGLLNGKTVSVEITRKGNVYDLTINGNRFTVDAFRPRRQCLSMLVEGKSYEVGLKKDGDTYSVSFFNDTIEFDLIDARKFQSAVESRPAGTSGPLKIQAPMPGKIVKVTVTEKAVVNQGDSLLVMEAMKMQNELKAPKAGTVSRIHVQEGEPVSMSQILMVLD